MTGMEWAAVIGAVTTLVLGLLGLLGAAVRYIVSMILDAYKAQAKATTAAKDGEIAANKERIERHMVEIDHFRKREAEHLAIISDLRAKLRAREE